MTSDQRLAVGVDVGGTKIAAGVVAPDGEVIANDEVPTPTTSADAVADAVAGLVRDLDREHPLVAVGVALAGFVDRSRERLLFAPNLAFSDVPLRASLEQRLGLPVVLENDANAAAWGEYRYGSGTDTDDLLLVTVGTGVGGGMVLDGEVYRGGAGVAAEIGHLRVERDGRLCGCGNLGCWEQYASGTALDRDARAAAAADPAGHAELVARAGGRAEEITGEMVTTAAADGDAAARARLTTLGEWLGEGLASLATVLDPSVVLVGGGVAAAGDLLLDPARASLVERLPARAYRPVPVLRPAVLGNTAGTVGAADLARRDGVLG